MLSLHHVSRSFNLDLILSDITFHVSDGDRIGLIGPNGSGKTTLLRIAAGQDQPDAGTVVRTPPDLRIGYLAQGFNHDERQSVAALIDEATGGLEQLARRLGTLGEALAQAPDDPELRGAYDRAVTRMARAAPQQSGPLLAALGLAEIDLAAPAGQLSGGQKTRLSLLLLLLGSPDLLLLDEPTNHLDLEMLAWLETWVCAFTGGVVIVSHDRTFLDRTVNRILDLNPETHRATEYEGNFSSYLAQVTAERSRQWAAFRAQEAEIRRMRQDIARTFEQARSVERSTTPRQPNVRRLAKKVARKAKSREKKLDRYLEAEERVEKPLQGWQMKVAFDESPHIGRDVVRLEGLAIGYTPDSPLLSGLNLNIQARERVALIGRNGCGKTTLLRTIAGELPPLAGRVHLGGSVQLGYMSQEQELLDERLSALETIARNSAIPQTETEMRSFLHFFLFKDDDPLREVGRLSFGERARLALATLVTRGSTFLILDEPINHLDIPSRTQFEQALTQFPGTVLAVVHDRYFIERYATRIWAAADGSVTARFL